MNAAEQTVPQPHDYASCDDLCRVHYPRVLQLCRLLLVDRRDAEEIAQEVFLKLVQEYKREIEIRSWEAWLVRVTVNTCHDRRRSAWWKWWQTHDNSFQEDDLPSPSPTPEEQFLSREGHEQVWKALYKLSARQREVFVLRRLEGWSTAEVAETLGLTAGSVKRHLFHALRHLDRARGGRDMNRCLSNKMLYLLYAGDENAAQRFHLNQCATCTTRYEQLAQRLATVEQMLQQSPPPFLDAKQWKPQLVYRQRFSLAAAALVVVLAFTGRVLLRKESPQVRPPQIPNQEVSRFFEDEVSSALFATTDISESSIPTPVSDTAYLEAALTDSWPCEQREASSVVECDIHPLPLPNERY